MGAPAVLEFDPSQLKPAPPQGDSLEFDPSELKAAPAASEHSLKPGPEPGFWERVKGAIVGSPQTGDTPIGRALGYSYEAPSEKHVPTTELPMLRATELAPEVAQVAGAINPTIGAALQTPVGKGVVKGATSVAEGLTTAPNLLMAAGSGGFGLLGQVSKILPRAISAGFTVQMLHQAYEQVPAFKQAWDSGDPEAIAKAVTEMAATLGMAGASGVHAARAEAVPTSKEPPAISEVVQPGRIEPPISEFSPEELTPAPAPREEVVQPQNPVVSEAAGAVPEGGNKITESRPTEVPVAQPSQTNGIQSIPAEVPALPEGVSERVPSEPAQPGVRELPEVDSDKAGASEEKETTSVQTRQPSPEAGIVAELPVEEIHADPTRFQFKSNVGKGGAGEESRSITTFDPEKSGIVSVWKDPADGKTYVVNGHNRLDMAKRLGAPTLTVRYLDADNAQEARTKGALINIAEGRGDAIDAAKVFRDGAFTEDSLKAEGVSLKGEKARAGLALANLDPSLFSKVVSGEIPAERAAVIGEGLPDHADQKALFEALQSSEKKGKRPTNTQIAEMIRLTPPRVTETQDSLFGPQEMSRSLIPQKAEISDYIRTRLMQDKRLFAAVGNESASERLGEAGNVIQAGKNAEVAERTAQAQALYDKLSTGAGPVNDALDVAAGAIAKGENAETVKQRTYGQIRQSLIDQAKSLTGASKAPTERPQGNVQTGPDKTSTGEQDLPVAEITSSTESESTTPSAEEHGTPPIETAPESKSPAKTDSKAEEHEKSSTQANLPTDLAEKVRAAAAKIPDSELADKGREDEPHVTLLYGTKTDNPADVAKLMEGERPIKAKIGGMSIFLGKNGDPDVVKLDVDSSDLRRLNAKIKKNLPNENDHPVYKPHVTVAYVENGKGAKYAGRTVPGLSGKEVTFDSVHFSPRDGEKTEIPLGEKIQAGRPETKPSKLAQGVEEKAIANKLTVGFEGKPEYETIKVAEQAKMASDLIRDDPEKATKIAMGEEPPPEGLLPESVFVAMEDYATKNKDVELLRDLATKSTLSSEATGMGQRIRMLAERDPNSPVAAIQKVTKAREEAAAKRFGPKAKDTIKKQIKVEIKKANAKPKSWIQFVDELTCK